MQTRINFLKDIIEDDLGFQDFTTGKNQKNTELM